LIFTPKNKKKKQQESEFPELREPKWQRAFKGIKRNLEITPDFVFGHLMYVSTV